MPHDAADRSVFTDDSGRRARRWLWFGRVCVALCILAIGAVGVTLIPGISVPGPDLPRILSIGGTDDAKTPTPSTSAPRRTDTPTTQRRDETPVSAIDAGRTPTQADDRPDATAPTPDTPSATPVAPTEDPPGNGGGNGKGKGQGADPPRAEPTHSPGSPPETPPGKAK